MNKHQTRKASLIVAALLAWPVVQAVEKCDALAGDAKASCLASAKAMFGKS